LLNPFCEYFKFSFIIIKLRDLRRSYPVVEVILRFPLFLGAQTAVSRRENIVHPLFVAFF